jgi:predicted nucleic acid-binding protein
LTAQAWSRDADDDKFIHAALAARAPWLVTGDQDLLSIPPMAHLKILTPAQALEACPSQG